MDASRSYFDITSGPSKDSLFDCCKYSFEKESNICIYFTVDRTRPKDRPNSNRGPIKITNVKIHGIEYEDGCGENFNLYGQCRANLNPTDKDAPKLPYKFEAYYSTKNRKGCMGFYDY